MSAALVVQTSFLGDTVLTTPLLAFLARSHSVDVVCTPPSAALLANNPSVHEVIPYDKRGSERGAAGFTRLAAKLRGRRYESAYLAQGSIRSGALAFMAGIADRVGFATSAGRPFYTTRIAAVENTHHAARLLALGTRDPLAEPSPAALRPRLYPGDKERAAVDELVGTVGPNTAIVGVFMADARCNGAESFVTSTHARRMSSADASNESRPVASMTSPFVAARISSASGRSPWAPMITTLPLVISSRARSG